jgi:hypothetical protein
MEKNCMIGAFKCNAACIAPIEIGTLPPKKQVMVLLDLEVTRSFSTHTVCPSTIASAMLKIVSIPLAGMIMFDRLGFSSLRTANILEFCSIRITTLNENSGKFEDTALSASKLPKCAPSHSWPDCLRSEDSALLRLSSIVKALNRPEKKYTLSKIVEAK